MSNYTDKEWLGYLNTKGEWYIAYHGTNIAKPILENGFRRGLAQAREYDNNINELSKKDGKIKLGKGVYCTPKIAIAKSYSHRVTFGGHSYHLVFMCRVNPYKVRMSDDKGYAKDYWVVSGDEINDPEGKKYDNEIRPYRILLKEK